MIRSAADFSLKPRRKGATRGNLFRREHNGVIYCRFFHTVNGKKKDVQLCTGKKVEVEARKVAFNLWQQETGNAPADAQKIARQRATSPKLGKIVDFYLENHRQCSSKDADLDTATKYVNTLGRAVRLVTGTEGDAWKESNLSILSDTFVHDWRAAKYKQRGLDINKTADRDLYFNKNLNTEMQQCRSLFGKQALMAYQDAGMVIPPQLVRFLSVRSLNAEEKGFQRIDPEVDALMQQQAADAIAGRPLKGLPSAPVAVIYELARFCGLTRKEIVNLQVDWIAKDHSYIEVQPFKDEAGNNFQTKANSKNGRIPTNPDRVKRWLKALKRYEGRAEQEIKAKDLSRGARAVINARRRAPGYLIPGYSKTQRENLCDYEANPWIAKHLPDRTKRLHELRKQAGSDVYQKSKSLTAAAAFIRDSEVTARKYYLPKGHDSAQFGVVGL